MVSAPFTRAQAITNAEATASQQSVAHGGSSPVRGDALRSLRVEFVDSWDSRWQRDPGRANGPYS